MMDDPKWPERKTGSVKEAITSYRERILEANTTIKKNQANNPEKLFSGTRELHMAKRDTSQLNERRKLAESATAEAKSKLSAAQKTVRDLTRRIEESNARAKDQMQELEKHKMARRREAEWNSAKAESEEVMRELDAIKRELSQLKLEMASISEEKRRAEEESESSLSKAESRSRSIEAITKEIEEVNEEHVLVELARIEAVKEYGEIEAQKREAAERHLAAIEEAREKKEKIIREMEDEREMEMKLAITISDANVLQSELKQVKEMEERQEKNEIQSDIREEDELDSNSLLESVTNELEIAKRELNSVRDECFQFMASMDVVRNELKHLTEETARHKKKENKIEMIIQNLNAKILRATDKLVATSAAEEKAQSIVSNLEFTLEQLRSETEAAKKERSLVSEETAVIKAEVQRTETEIDEADERLKAALQDLKVAKSSEAIALENLKSLIEKIMKNRASASRSSSHITVSKFEYEYLTGHATGAKEIADKKVAAAEAWIQALKASEKEILMKIELSRRETRELRVEQEHGDSKAEQLNNENGMSADEYENSGVMMEPQILQPGIALPSKTMNKSIKTTPARRAKPRISSSPGFRAPSRSTSFTVRRRKKVIPNLTQFFSGRSTETNV